MITLSCPFGPFPSATVVPSSFRAAGEAKLRAMGVKDEDILRRALVITACVVRGTMEYTVPAKEPGGEPVAVSFRHLEASPAPSPNLRLSPDLDLVYVLREGPMRLSEAQRAQLVGIGGAEAEAALAALAEAEWSPLLVLEFAGLGAAQGLGLASEEELQERWQSHASALKALIDTGVEGQGRGFATSSTVSERLWCAAFSTLPGALTSLTSPPSRRAAQHSRDLLPAWSRRPRAARVSRGGALRELEEARPTLRGATGEALRKH